MKKFIQCRLRRSHQVGQGYSEMVTYLPTHGTNGGAVAVGRSVNLCDDPDQRPWQVFAASDHVVDASFIARKRDEGRDLANVIR